MPIWCYTQPPAGPATRQSGANDWVDTWDNSGASIQQLNDRDYDYRRFDINSEGRIKVGYFINMDHWMPDIADASTYSLDGGSLLSPNRQFRFENGTLVVEGDFAAGSDGMGGADAFYEMDISPAAAPTGVTVDPLYGYGAFGGVGSLGCRFERQQDGGHVVCAMYDNSTRDAGGTDVTGGPSGRPGRVWEAQGVGSGYTAPVVEGGYPQWPIPGTNMHVSDVWRQCADNELDLHCRDRFRMEITQTSLHIFVNGYVVYRIDGLYASNPHTGADNRVPSSYLNGSISAYYTSWINSGMHHATRWHWDRLAINPHSGSGFAAPSAAPSFCLGQPNNTCPDPAAPGASTPVPTSTTPPAQATRTPVPTSTAVPTATSVPPTRTPVPTSTPTSGPGGATSSGAQTVNFDNLPDPNRAFTGEYPSGVINWGSNAWYLSGPYDKFRTQSFSFNGSGLKSASFSFTSPRTLTALDVDNGGTASTTITLACAGQPSVTKTLAALQSATLMTGWTSPCTTVTVTSTNGWYVNFDNLKIQ